MIRLLFGLIGKFDAHLLISQSSLFEQQHHPLQRRLVQRLDLGRLRLYILEDLLFLFFCQLRLDDVGRRDRERRSRGRRGFVDAGRSSIALVDTPLTRVIRRFDDSLGPLGILPVILVILVTMKRPFRSIGRLDNARAIDIYWLGPYRVSDGHNYLVR